MDRLAELFEKREEKIERLREFIVIFGRRSELYETLKQLDMANKENAGLVNDVKKSLVQQRDVYLPMARKMIDKSDRLQQSMLNMIEEMCKQNEAGQESKENQNNNAKKPQLPFDSRTPLKENSDQNQNKPQSISMSDYKCSPHARRMKPVALHFVDFETNISKEDFAKIPQYMKGRESLDELRHFLDTVIVKCFTSKYMLMHKHREIVRNQHDLNMWRHYHQQADYFPNRLFITQGDISHETGKMVDKKTANRIAMLRHIQVLQELRHKTTVCYIWLAN